MAHNSDILSHSKLVLHPDSGRTVIRPFAPGDPAEYADPRRPRPQRIADRVLALSEEQVHESLERLIRVAAWRIPDFEHYLLHRFEEVNGLLIDHCTGSDARKQLIAAFFCAEYSFEAAALFNPSMVPHPAGPLPDGRVRFLMSLRGVGEGHVSSVTFRTGTWSENAGFEVEAPGDHGVMLRVSGTEGEGDRAVTHLVCESDCDISEMVLFPATASQRQGVEDMRLVLFAEDDGPPRLYGTYTAFDGREARPEMMCADDRTKFTLRPLRGRYSTGKGMALFPRRIGGRYVMLSRQDQENIWLLVSDDIYDWNEGQKLLTPAQPWEFVQLGNCGSPVEIEEGWLVLTHGVGVVRSYAIGACLLDKEDPSRVIGRMAEPLLRPAPVGAREGYVPNVVYSCGGMVHERTLLLPYAVADTATRFASVSLDALLAQMS